MHNKSLKSTMYLTLKETFANRSKRAWLRLFKGETTSTSGTLTRFPQRYVNHIFATCRFRLIRVVKIQFALSKPFTFAFSTRFNHNDPSGKITGTAGFPPPPPGYMYTSVCKCAQKQLCSTDNVLLQSIKQN